MAPGHPPTGVWLCEGGGKAEFSRASIPSEHGAWSPAALSQRDGPGREWGGTMLLWDYPGAEEGDGVSVG